MILAQLSRLLGECQNIVAFLSPHFCVLCDCTSRNPFDLCPVCTDMLSENRHACAVCGLPMHASSPRVCGACLTHPPPYSATLACFQYSLPADYFVCELKFSGKLVFGRLLGELMAREVMARGVVLPEALVPVPLGADRLLGRGFNQSAEIAYACSRALVGPAVDTSLVRRVRDTHPQSQLKAIERRKNIRGAFSVAPRAAGYRHVALVDDVMTTGSTVAEIARRLRAAGVQRVDVWVAARVGAEPDSIS